MDKRLVKKYIRKKYNGMDSKEGEWERFGETMGSRCPIRRRQRSMRWREAKSPLEHRGRLQPLSVLHSLIKRHVCLCARV